LKITGIQRPKARKDLEQLAKQFLTGLAQAFTKRADSLRTIVQFRDALPDDIRRQLRGSLMSIQHETGALADQLEDKPTAPRTTPTAILDQSATSNKFHREVTNWIVGFAPRFRAWSTSTKLQDEAKDSLHDVLMLAANELMTLAQEIDGRGTAQMAEAA
jgi:hypothetical protein